MKSTFIGGILVVLALLFGILFYFIPDSGELPVDEELGELTEEFPEEPTEYLYGLPVDSFKVTVDKIQKNAQKYPVDKAKGNAKKYDEL